MDCDNGYVRTVLLLRFAVAKSRHRAGLFLLFAAGMAGSSIYFVIKNFTTIENLNRKTKVWLLAVRAPTQGQLRHGPDPTQPASQNSINEAGSRHEVVRSSDSGQSGHVVLKTKPGENPWDLGPYENWKSIMGESFVDWLLPLRYSPCRNHNRLDSYYPLGPVVERLRREAGLRPYSAGSSVAHRKHRRRRRHRGHSSSVRKGERQVGEDH